MSETLQYVIVGVVIVGAVVVSVVKCVRLFGRKGNGCSSCPPGCKCPKSRRSK